MVTAASTVVAHLSDVWFERILTESVDYLRAGPGGTREAVRLFLATDNGREVLRRVQQGMLESIRHEFAGDFAEALAARITRECDDPAPDYGAPVQTLVGMQHAELPLLEIARTS